MPQAIWLDKDNEVSLRTIDEKWKPGKGEVLVKVAYSGVNPADIKHGHLGFHENVAGYDFAGEILELGEGMDKKFKVGDTVCGLGAPMLNKPPQYGAHQQYHVARNFIHRVPPNFKLEIAATMPVAVEAAADGLINQLGLELGSKEQHPILIWGGAASVGSVAIQLAKAAGCYPIITTASPKNHATLLSLGADKCFDYRATDVEQQISAAMDGKKFPYVFDCVVAKGNGNSLSSTKICENLSTADAKCAAALPIVESEKQWPRVFACRDVDVDFILPNGYRLVHKANLAWQEKMNEAFAWAIEHYGNGFVMPNVKIVKGGQESLQALRISASGSASLEKFAIQHPL